MCRWTQQVDKKIQQPDAFGCVASRASDNDPERFTVQVHGRMHLRHLRTILHCI
jgi:hypothetical protein